MGIKELFTNSKNTKNSKSEEEYTLGSPTDGTVIPIDGVADEVFSARILGDGFAVIPSGEEICAPCDGRIDTVFDTSHAVSMTSDFGAELLIHCGIDTVKLSGEGFSPRVSSGQRVKRGDPLLSINSALIKEKGFSLTTPVVILNSECFAIVSVGNGDKRSGETAATLERKK